MIKASKRIVFRELNTLNQEVAKITTQFRYDVEVEDDYRAGKVYRIIEIHDGMWRTPNVSAGDMVNILTGMIQIVKDINDAIFNTGTSQDTSAGQLDLSHDLNQQGRIAQAI